MLKRVHIIAALFCAVTLFACKKDEEPFLSVSPENIILSQSGLESIIEIQSNISWTCEISPPLARGWLSLERSEGPAGNYSVKAAALPNETSESKTATLYVEGGGITRTVGVVQRAAAKVEVSQSLFNVESQGGILNIVVYSNVGLEIDIEGEWIHNTTRTVGSRAPTPEEFTFTVDENTAYEARDGKIIFSDKDGFTSDEVSIHQYAALPPLVVSPASLDYPAANTTGYLTVTTAELSWTVEVADGEGWCTAGKEGTGRAKISTQANYGNERRATIRVRAGEHSQEIALTQNEFDPSVYYTDRQVFRLRQATVGNGIDIIVLGDGYTLNDMGRDGNGKYETDMRAAADHFFSVYPYDAYEDYFNVYMVTAISEEAGMSTVSPPMSVDTKFETLWNGTSTWINCNDATVKNYVSAVTLQTGRQMKNMTVIMPINKNVYAGTCLMWIDGFSIAMIPVGASFGKLVVHEAGGHGFAKLIDEYVYYEDPIPLQTKNDILTKKQSGFYINADFSDNILETTWSGFANNPKYPMVGTYEGAYMYSTGIWRPEQTSSMSNNALYFNAPSRWAQVKRIHELAGIPYSFDQFLLDDDIPAFPAAAESLTRYAEPFIPTAPPIVFTTPSDD